MLCLRGRQQAKDLLVDLRREAIGRNKHCNTDIPYAVIESDGDSITAGQLRQLEIVAVQSRRKREASHESPAA